MRQSSIPSLTVPETAGPSDYFALLKPRVMSLVIFTAAVAMVAAAAQGATIHIGLALAAS